MRLASLLPRGQRAVPKAFLADTGRCLISCPGRKEPLNSRPEIASACFPASHTTRYKEIFSLHCGSERFYVFLILKFPVGRNCPAGWRKSSFPPLPCPPPGRVCCPGRRLQTVASHRPEPQ